MAARSQSILPTVIWVLLIANGLIFAAQAIAPGLILTFGLWPIHDFQMYPSFKPWQLVSYAFLHGNLTHLFFNMFALWMFGMDIERVWGTQRFTLYFAVCVIGAGLIQLAVSTSGAAQGDVYPTIGASGGVFGILLAFGMMFPDRRILMLFFPVPIKAKYFVLFYGLLEFLFGVSGAQPGVAHFAHLGGMLFGFVLIQYWRGKLPFKR